MYMRKTKTRIIADVTYYSYRLVETMRMASGKVHQITLLNLGSSYTAIDESEWALLTDRVKDLLHGVYALFVSGSNNLYRNLRRFINCTGHFIELTACHKYVAWQVLHPWGIDSVSQC